ncbi:cell wall hydrolase [Erythrobacter sp. sf7]|uniref:Cell wall hydrolase n=1 Tax=Erythrobacter fulvus TaxID=2987523 RepID=A0ABT5JPM0_9SPHN|nr:cell wall hydrolase [Erythrobacter fulvus]MDC8754732.1 cell wall hydrolase [Erythrobacter fulvus]
MPAARAPFAFFAQLAAAIPVTGVWRKRLAVLAAAIAVPALAAPGNLLALPGPAAGPDTALATRQAARAALPFERPGMSFPGSAFFYMADPAGAPLVALPKSDPLSVGAEDGRELGAIIDVGAPAKPFFAAATGLGNVRAQECLAQAVWYEAASESEAGQRAVAQVVLNRVAHPGWPASVCGVVYQGSERRTGCQFTFTCDGSLARRPGGASWARAQRIAAEALSGSVYAPVGHATHYHTLWVNPYWAATLDHVGTIGAHRFYRLRGASGEKSAFTMAYAGIENGPAARIAAAPVLESPAETPRPVIAYDLGPVPLAAQARPAAKSPPAAPAPAPVEAYSGAGSVKAEYARAGQWKTRQGDTPTPADTAASASE